MYNYVGFGRHFNYAKMNKVMKKRYITPEVKIIKVRNENILQSSGNYNGTTEKYEWDDEEDLDDWILD